MDTLLTTLLAERAVLLADGAMGTNLFALGLETGASPDLWNVDRPDQVAQVHRGFVEAGSDIILTNTFGANRSRLSLHDAQDRVAELNVAGARIARSVADAADRPIVVAGSMGPTGDIFEPVGTLGRADGEAVFAEQAAALAEGGVDTLWVETISAAEELAAAVAGSAPAGLPVVATMTFDTNGRTMMGLTPAAAMVLREDLPTRLAAFGANCGIGPSQLVASILGLAAAAGPGDIVVAKGNCGIPQYRDGAIHYDGTPTVMATYARLARDAGAGIIGGCCGTMRAHIRAMAEALEAHTKGRSPDLDTIARLLGPIAAPARRAPVGDAQPRRGRRRR